MPQLLQHMFSRCHRATIGIYTYKINHNYLHLQVFDLAITQCHHDKKNSMLTSSYFCVEEHVVVALISFIQLDIRSTTDLNPSLALF